MMPPTISATQRAVGPRYNIAPTTGIRRIRDRVTWLAVIRILPSTGRVRPPEAMQVGEVRPERGDERGELVARQAVLRRDGPDQRAELGIVDAADLWKQVVLDLE